MPMFTVDPNSFGLGFLAGTSVYIVAGYTAYALFSACKRLAGLFTTRAAPARRRTLQRTL